MGAPRWLDLRLVGGVLLILLSVVVGARVFASADKSEPVWVAARDLPAGTQLTAADLRPGRVHLYGQRGRYVSGGGSPPVGYVLTRAIGHDELLPRAAIDTPGRVPPFRLVTVPVQTFHLPPHLAAGDRVDVYVTPNPGGDRPGQARRVYAGALVAAVDRGAGDLGGTGSDTGVVLSVPPAAAATLVTAIHAGDVDLTRLPSSGSPP